MPDAFASDAKLEVNQRVQKAHARACELAGLRVAEGRALVIDSEDLRSATIAAAGVPRDRVWIVNDPEYGRGQNREAFLPVVIWDSKTKQTKQTNKTKKTS